jgi:hypothetical protein
VDASRPSPAALAAHDDERSVAGERATEL